MNRNRGIDKSFSKNKDPENIRDSLFLTNGKTTSAHSSDEIV